MTVTSEAMAQAATRYLDRVIEEQEIDLADPYSVWADRDAQKMFITALRSIRSSVTPHGANGVRLMYVPKAAWIGTAALDYAATTVHGDRDPEIFTDTLIAY